MRLAIIASIIFALEISHCFANESQSNTLDMGQLKQIIATQQAEIAKLRRDLDRVISPDGRWIGSPTGLIGPQGPAGPQGEAGPIGPQGPTGPQGIAPWDVSDLSATTIEEQSSAVHFAIAARKHCQSRGYQYGFAGGEISGDDSGRRNIRVICMF